MLKVWDFAKTSSSELQSLSFDNKSSLLKTYYVEMLSKQPVGKGKTIFFLLSGNLQLCFDWILALFWVKFGFALFRSF